MNYEFTLALPDWVSEFLGGRPARLVSPEAGMGFVVELSAENVRRGGGPFAAAVFGPGGGDLVAVGVNVVLQSGIALAHAEVMALALAQKACGTVSLSGNGGCELYSSCEPCGMCMGATLWSGVTRLVCGARDEDARAVGFDEGLKHARWPEELARRGVVVERDLLREEAAKVLRDYKDSGGLIYNGREERPGGT